MNSIFLSSDSGNDELSENTPSSFAIPETLVFNFHTLSPPRNPSPPTDNKQFVLLMNESEAGNGLTTTESGTASHETQFDIFCDDEAANLKDRPNRSSLSAKMSTPANGKQMSPASEFGGSDSGVGADSNFFGFGFGVRKGSEPFNFQLDAKEKVQPKDNQESRLDPETDKELNM
jgi:hypothetical protein